MPPAFMAGHGTMVGACCRGRATNGLQVPICLLTPSARKIKYGGIVALLHWYLPCFFSSLAPHLEASYHAVASSSRQAHGLSGLRSRVSNKALDSFMNSDGPIRESLANLFITERLQKRCHMGCHTRDVRRVQSLQNRYEYVQFSSGEEEYSSRDVKGVAAEETFQRLESQLRRNTASLQATLALSALQSLCRECGVARHCELAWSPSWRGAVLLQTAQATLPAGC
eukprot:821807-Amphidinium_carterae.1